MTMITPNDDALAQAERIVAECVQMEGDEFTLTALDDVPTKLYVVDKRRSGKPLIAGGLLTVTKVSNTTPGPIPPSAFLGSWHVNYVSADRKSALVSRKEPLPPYGL